MQRTQTERLWLVGATLVAFVIALVGYFFFISPQRAQTADVENRIGTADTQNVALQSRISVLAAQNKKLATYRQELHDAQLALPATSGMPDFLRTLQAIGTATSTTVTSVSVGAPTGLGGAAIAAPTPVTSSSSASPDPSASASAGPSGVYAIPLTVAITGSDTQLSAFLTQLQSVQPRAVLITDITRGTTTPAATTTSKVGGGKTSLQLTMQAFVAPSGAAAAPVAAPTPTPSASP